MVRYLKCVLLLIAIMHPLSADITVNSSTVDLTGSNATQLVSKLDTALDQLFYAVASLAGPGVVNAAAFSSTLGIQRQNAELPKFQLEPSLGLILPGDGKGDEKIKSLPLYAVSIVGGYRLSEKTAIQARAFYLPEISIPVKNVKLNVQPYNFGITLTRRIKAQGSEWYNPAIITPLDFGYMHGALSATFNSDKSGVAFDPSGTGKSAEAKISFEDQFKLNWDVYTFTTGLIFVKPFFEIFTARLGVLSSLNLGYASLANTANTTLIVTTSNGSGPQEFKVNDTASISIRNSATFKPVLVSNQLTLGVGIALGPAALNVDFSQNLQLNARGIIVQFGCWF